MRRSLLVNLGLALVSLALTLLGTELALRWVLLHGLNPFEPDPEIGYRLKAGFDGAYPRVAVRTDALRRRIPTTAEREPSGRLLFIGDSVTFGFGVRARDAYPYRLGELLGRPGDVANAAVPGYNLGQALVTLRESLERTRPELVVYGAVVNDVAGADHPVTYADIDPHASRMEGGGLLARSVLVAFVQRRWRRLASRLEIEEDAAGADEEASVAPRMTENMEEASRPAAVAAFDGQLRRLKQLERSRGVPIQVLVLPFRQQLEDPSRDAWQRFMAERCRELGLRCLDPFPMLLHHRDEPLFNGDSSYHFNPRGHRLMAEWLAERLDAGAPPEHR